MIAQARYLLKLLLYWLLLFAAGRLAFMLYFHENYSRYGLTGWLGAFTHALRLDLSTAGYVLLLPLVVSSVALWVGWRLLRVFHSVYQFIVTFSFIVITISDIGLYTSWGCKVNARAVSNLEYPASVTNSMDFGLLAKLLGIALLIGVFAYGLNRWLFRSERKSLSKNRVPWFAVPFVFTAWLALLVVMIRGGLQLIPVTESAAYYSTDVRLNHAAVNTCWYVMHSMFENREMNNPRMFDCMPSSTASRIVDSLYARKHDDMHVLTTLRPNIVFIQLESFTADVIEALGGEKDVTPNLDTLLRHALLFTNIYSPGMRTDQGVVSILCAFPAQPTASIIKQSDKIERMPNLTELLKRAGYSTVFHYGGELGFANLQSFMEVNGFDKISSITDYSKEQLSAKWGAHDEYVLQKQAGDLNAMREPFFAYLMTLSSHEPFEVPMKKFTGTSNPEKFKNSCAYTDRCLGDYFKRVSKLPWFHNTLFILCADHGHELPRNRVYNEPARFHIPVIFFGEVLKPEYRGARIVTFGGQNDLASTLLNQLGMPDTMFRWSNDLLDSSRHEFAYYSFDDGVGFITPRGAVGYDFKNRKRVYAVNMQTDTSALVTDCQAYLQRMMGDYFRY